MRSHNGELNRLHKNLRSLTSLRTHRINGLKLSLRINRIKNDIRAINHFNRSDRFQSKPIIDIPWKAESPRETQRKLGILATMMTVVKNAFHRHQGK